MTLFVLDTDHLSLYQRDFEPLLSKLLSHPPDELAITIVTVEEQLRGRLAQIRKAECYRWLGETVDQVKFKKIPPATAGRSDKKLPLGYGTRSPASRGSTVMFLKRIRRTSPGAAPFDFETNLRWV